MGTTLVRKGENVIISDNNFWMYMTEDTALFQWDPPTATKRSDQDDVLLDIHVSERQGDVEISTIPAAGIPALDVGWSFKVYQSPWNPRGCNAYSPEFFPGLGGEQSTAVVVDRGECTFLEKVRGAKTAGFDLVIVVDSSLAAGQRFIPSFFTEKQADVSVEELIPLVFVTGRRDSAYIKRAEQVRIAGFKKRERRMVVRGGNNPSTPASSLLIVEYVSNVIVQP